MAVALSEAVEKPPTFRRVAHVQISIQLDYAQLQSSNPGFKASHVSESPTRWEERKVHNKLFKLPNFRYVRFQEAINRAMPRRKPKRAIEKTSIDISYFSNSLESREPMSSETRDHGEILAETMKVQQQLLDDETRALHVKLLSLLDAACDTETKMVEMSSLNHLIYVRFQEAINRAMPRRKPKRAIEKTSIDISYFSNSLESREPMSSETRDHGEILAETMKVQQQLLDDETRALHVKLLSLLDAACDTETKMVEMSSLNHLMILRKDEIKLRMLRTILNDMKEDFNKNHREIKKIVEDIRPRFHISYAYNYAFEVLFGAKYDSFRDTIFQNMDRLNKQFAKEEFHDDIERVIVDRTHHENELRIRKDVKEKQEKLEMQKQEMMIQKSKCSSPGANSDAKRENQVKEKCIVQFRLLYTHLEFLSRRDSENTCSSSGFQWAFGFFFGEEVEYFAPRMFFNLDKLEKQLNNEEFDEEDESSRSGNDTLAEGENIRLFDDTKPLNEVDHDVEQCLDKRPLIASVLEKKTTKFLNQTLVSKNDCLKKTIAQLQKEFSKLEAQRKVDCFLSLIVESNISELEKESGENIYENEKCDLQTKIVELEKVLTQQTKDFDDVKLELSNRTAKFEAYFDKLKNMKVVLERQLARKIDDSKAEKDQLLKEGNRLRTQLENLKWKSVKTKFDKPSILGKPPADKLLINSQISKSWYTPKVVVQKDLSKPVNARSLPKNEKDQLLKLIASSESKLASQDLRSCQKKYHELRTSYNALKVKFDSLNLTKRKTNVSKSSKPIVSVLKKDHTGESSKPFSKRISQFTTYSLQKELKGVFGTSTKRARCGNAGNGVGRRYHTASRRCLTALGPALGAVLKKIILPP
nr:syntaxin-81 [Tanacetum cinerariifolium]